VLDLPLHVIALHLGNTDGGRLVRELYGHPDAAMARDRVREAYLSLAKATPLDTAAGNGCRSGGCVLSPRVTGTRRLGRTHRPQDVLTQRQGAGMSSPKVGCGCSR
jgi:hypothetical protein